MEARADTCINAFKKELISQELYKERPQLQLPHKRICILRVGQRQTPTFTVNQLFSSEGPTDIFELKEI